MNKQKPSGSKIPKGFCSPSKKCIAKASTFDSESKVKTPNKMKTLLSRSLIFYHPRFGKKVFQKNSILFCSDLIKKLGQISDFNFSSWNKDHWKNAVNYLRLYLIGERVSGQFDNWELIGPTELAPNYGTGKFLNYQQDALNQVLTDQDFVLYNTKFPEIEPLIVSKGQYKEKGLRGIIVDALDKLPKDYHYKTLTYNQQRNFRNYFLKLLKDQNISYLGWRKKSSENYLKTDVLIVNPKANISIEKKEWSDILNSSDTRRPPKKFLNQVTIM